MGLMGLGVGVGSTVRLWHDKWGGDNDLKVAFPTLFNLFLDNNEMVADWMEWVRESILWAPLFRRNSRDDEVRELARLL